MTFLVPDKIETQRLILRTFREDDWRDLCVLYADEETTRYTIRHTLNEDETWRTMPSLSVTGNCVVMGLMPWKIRSPAKCSAISVSGTPMPGLSRRSCGHWRDHFGARVLPARPRVRLNIWHMKYCRIFDLSA